MFEKAAKERQGTRTDISTNLRSSSEPHKAAEDAAKLLNISPRSVESASRVLEHGTPELVQVRRPRRRPLGGKHFK